MTVRKRQWTEKEDLRLICCVGQFGDRNWDSIAEASGLHRSGKSCRLRWVNYLRPGLKRDRMTPKEKRLVLDLHSRWGNRWSRIARRLPGRTDNEIKNYWRTYVRKKAREGKGSCTLVLSSSCCLLDEPRVEAADEEGAEAGGAAGRAVTLHEENKEADAYLMEQIWNEIAPSGMNELTRHGGYEDETCNVLSCSPPVGSSQTWDYSDDSLWEMDDEELKKMFPPIPWATSPCRPT